MCCVLLILSTSALELWRAGARGARHLVYRDFTASAPGRDARCKDDGRWGGGGAEVGQADSPKLVKLAQATGCGGARMRGGHHVVETNVTFQTDSSLLAMACEF